MKIRRGDFDDPRVVALLQTHFTTARAQSPPGSAHALDLAGLQAPGIEFWALWGEQDLLAIGALKQHSQALGEIKSMHTASSRRRTGAGGLILNHLIDRGRSLGLSRLSLETGVQDYFRPAVALYRKHGFVESPPFADYVVDPNSLFLTLDLTDGVAPTV